MASPLCAWCTFVTERHEQSHPRTFSISRDLCPPVCFPSSACPPFPPRLHPLFNVHSNQVLPETDWTQPVADLKPIRDSLYAAFGVERVVRAQQKHPHSSHDNTHTLLLQCLLITRVITTVGVPSDNTGFAAGRGDNRPQEDAGEAVAGRQLQAVREGDALLKLTMCARARANKVLLFTALPKTALRSDAMPANMLLHQVLRRTSSVDLPRGSGGGNDETP